MVIKIQKLRYEIQEVNLAIKLEEMLLQDYKTSFHDFSKTVDSWDSKTMQDIFLNMLSNIGDLLAHIENFQDQNTDEDTNIEIFNRQYISEHLNSISELPDYIIKYDKALTIYYRFTLSAFTEFLIFIGLDLDRKARFGNLSEDPDLKLTSEIKSYLTKFYPTYERGYKPEPFKIIGKYVKLLNPPELSKSILVIGMNKTEFEDYLDHIFPGDKILNNEVKKRLKTWFHYSKNQKKDIEPIFFEENDDQPFYIAYFLKFSGITQEKKTKFEALEFIKKSNKWLENNLLSIKWGTRFGSFADLNDAFTKSSRKKEKNNIDLRLENYKIQKNNPK